MNEVFKGQKEFELQINFKFKDVEDVVHKQDHSLETMNRRLNMWSAQQKVNGERIDVLKEDHESAEKRMHEEFGK